MNNSYTRNKTYVNNQKSYNSDSECNFNNKPRFNNNNNNSNNSTSCIKNCSKCGNPMRLLMNKANQTYFLGCSSYPNCKNTLSINNPIVCRISNKKCNKCSKDNLNIFMYEVSQNENGPTEYICLYNCLSDSKQYPNRKSFNNNKKFGGKRKNYSKGNKTFNKKNRKGKKVKISNEYNSNEIDDEYE